MPSHFQHFRYSTARQWLQPLCFLVFGLALGCFSRWVRGQLPGPVHWEMIGSLLLLAAATLSDTLLRRKQRTLEATLGSFVDIVGLWIGFGLGWLWIHGQYWDDMAVLVLGGWLCGFTGVTVILTVLRHRGSLRIGPWCPQCGYHLIGLPDPVCPECGRPFTLAELGIAAADLSAVSTPTTSPGAEK